nr:retrovirus-related Pol polyprotein from transposon TNT 1-94 [Tanacetum cinerariifolium]
MVEKYVVNNKGKGTGEREVRPVWNNARRVNHQNFSKMTHPHPKRNFVPTAVAIKSGQVLVNDAKQNSAASTSTARPKVNTAATRPNVNAKSSYFKPLFPKRKNFNQRSAAKTNTFLRKINTDKGKNVTIAGPKAVINAVEAKKENVVKSSTCWIWRPKGKLIDHTSNDSGSYTLKIFNYDQGIFNSGCSRHMTGNKSFITEYQEIDVGFIAFGGSPKGGKITGDLTCLLAKATINESNLWHRRLGHINFKTLNKLVRGNLFCQMKEINREFSVARTLQQNRVAERKNKTLIEAGRTMLANSLLPTMFLAEAVNTVCYVQNRVLVTKPHNKTPYELLIGRSPNIEFMRPFRCPVTILNTFDHLGKFDGKADEGFLVGYSVNSKAFRVFNSGTRKVEENLHVNFLENKPNVAGSGPEWLFDIDSLTKFMNYEPVSAGNQSNGDVNVGDQQGDVNAGDIQGDFEEISRNDDVCQGNEIGINSSTYAVNAASTSINTASNIITDGSLNINIADSNHTNTPILEAIGIFDGAFDDRDLGAEADTNNLDFFTVVNPIPTTRVHKDHPKEQIIRDPNLNTQTRRMINFSKETAMEMCDAFEILMHEKFKMSSIGELTFFLGLQVKQKQDGIFISQDKYVAEILKKFGFSKVKHASTPMENSKPLLKDEDGQEVDVHIYRSMIGSLMYLTSSRPDIMFAVRIFGIQKTLPLNWRPTQTVTMQVLVWIGNLQLVDVNSLAIDLYPSSVKSRQWLKTPQQRLSMLLLRVVVDSAASWKLIMPSIKLQLLITATTKVKKVNDQEQIQALVDKTKIIITEDSIRGNLHLDDAEENACLLGEEIFEGLARMGRKQMKEAEVSHDESEDENHVPAPFSDPLPSGEDSFILNEVMVFCTNLQEQVLDLQEAKEIVALKKKVSKLNKWRKSRFRGLRRLKKFGLVRRVKSLMKKDGLGRTNDDEMFRVDDLTGEEVVIETTTGVKDSVSLTTNVTKDEVTMAQELAALKSTKSKVVANMEAIMDADRLLAEKLQAREKEEFSEVQKARLLVEPIKKRKIHFAALRAQEKRNPPPIKTQMKIQMSTYLKHMGGYKQSHLKGRSFDEIKKLFDREITKVNDLIAMDSEAQKSSEKEAQESSTKRTKEHLEYDISKKQKVDENVKPAIDDSEELRKCIEIVLDDGDEVLIEATPISSRSPTIIDYKCNAPLRKEDVMS